MLIIVRYACSNLCSHMCIPFSLVGHKTGLIKQPQNHINEVLHPRFKAFLRDSSIARPEITFILLFTVNMQQDYTRTDCWMYLHLNMALPVGPKH